MTEEKREKVKYKCLLDKIDLTINHSISYATSIIDGLSNLNWRLYLLEKSLSQEDIGDNRSIEQIIGYLGIHLSKLNSDFLVIQTYFESMKNGNESGQNKQED